MTHSRLYELLYLIAALGELISQIIDFPLLHFTSKPLLMIALLLYFNSRIKNRRSATVKLINTALVFAWIGDVVLMLHHSKAEGEEVNSLLFLSGLASFLIMHCCYIGVFVLSLRSQKGLIRRKPLVVVPLIILAGTNYIMLLPHLGDLAIPVFIYSGAIITMVAFAINRYSAVTSKSFWLVTAGAVLFMISDSIIGLSTFSHPFRMSELLIMATYIPAQYLIITGILKMD